MTIENKNNPNFSILQALLGIVAIGYVIYVFVTL